MFLYGFQQLNIMDMKKKRVNLIFYIYVDG